MKKKKGAYLIIEIVFAICVFAIIASAGVVNFKAYTDESKVNVAQNEVMQLGNAIAHYKYDTGKYPDPEKLSDLTIPGSGDLKGYGPWIPEIRNDPWGNAYQFQLVSNGYIVYCTENGKWQEAPFTDGAITPGSIAFHGL